MDGPFLIFQPAFPPSFQCISSRFSCPVPLLPCSAVMRAGLAQNRTSSGTTALNAEGIVVVDNDEGRITIEAWNRAEVRYEWSAPNRV